MTTLMNSRTNKGHLFSSHLFLLPAMKDFASCFNEHAVKVSNSSCSGSSSSSSSCNSSVVDNTTSALGAVTCLYRTKLSTPRELLVKVTWSKGNVGPVLSVGIDDNPSIHRSEPDAMNCPLLRKKKGSRSYVSGSYAVGLHWDIASAKYGSGPEPIDGFYVVIVVNSEFALLLGDMSRDYIRNIADSLPVAEFSMIGRKEQVVGHAHHSTRARFCDGGIDHEITVRCKGDRCDAKASELSVSVDKKLVVQVRSLRWNFRGNQTIFIDGSPVDLMWDVHDWWFGSSSGCAAFMFRTRSTSESRLWLEDEMLQREQQQATPGFSLLIQAFKSQ
ncbi:unnamed protein product [Musa acuminata subsp. burmannicoides]